MEQKIELGNREIIYTLRLSKQARRLRLSVACGGVFTVSAPVRMGMGSIESFILKKADWVLRTVDYLKQFPRPVRKTESRKEFAAHKKQALLLVQERLNYFNQFYGFAWKKIAIRNQRFRWGSCSRKGNLSFNYRIVLLPAHLADYIIVHELCHLGRLDHSSKFWELAAETLPNHLALRRELRSKNSRLRS